jgi:hypothetical protein
MEYFGGNDLDSPFAFNILQEQGGGGSGKPGKALPDITIKAEAGFHSSSADTKWKLINILRINLLDAIFWRQLFQLVLCFQYFAGTKGRAGSRKLILYTKKEEEVVREARGRALLVLLAIPTGLSIPDLPQVWFDLWAQLRCD